MESLKFRLNTALNFIKKTFREEISPDIELSRSFDLISSSIKKLKDVEPQKDDQIKSIGTLPIPSELKKHGGFAIFSDGACRGNPGAGSWAALCQTVDGATLYERSGVEFHTTNNKMELEGAIQGLETLHDYFEDNKIKNSDNRVFLFSDSKYVVNGMNSWMAGWKSKGWKKADRKKPENLEYWQRLDEMKSKFSNLTVGWVAGHSGHAQNDRCDELANLALDSVLGK